MGKGQWIGILLYSYTTAELEVVVRLAVLGESKSGTRFAQRLRGERTGESN